MGIDYNEQAFVELAKKGDVVGINLFLRAGINPNAETDYWHQTALQHAAAGGNLQLVKTLIDAGADMKKAIRWAVINRQKHIIEFMLKKNPGQVAINLGLHAAVGNNAIDIVRTFINKGADVNFVNNFSDLMMQNNHTSVLMQALQNSERNYEEVNFLISKGADINLRIDDDEYLSTTKDKLQSALFVAVDTNNSDLVNLLLSNDAVVNIKSKNGLTPLHLAAMNCRHPMSSYEKNQQIRIFLSLLDNGAKLTDIGGINDIDERQTPLIHAINAGCVHIATLILQLNRDIDENEKNIAFLNAVKKETMFDVIKTLLDKGANPNIRNSDGYVILQAAALNREIIPLLLDYGADPCVRDNQGENILMKIFDIHEDTLQRLINMNVPINEVDGYGWTALMHAVKYRYDNPSYVRKLLKFGADIEIKNNVGDTALAIATRMDHRQTIHLLNNIEDNNLKHY